MTLSSIIPSEKIGHMVRACWWCRGERQVTNQLYPLISVISWVSQDMIHLTKEEEVGRRFNWYFKRWFLSVLLFRAGSYVVWLFPLSWNYSLPSFWPRQILYHTAHCIIILVKVFCVCYRHSWHKMWLTNNWTRSLVLIQHMLPHWKLALMRQTPLRTF